MEKKEHSRSQSLVFKLFDFKNKVENVWLSDESIKGPAFEKMPLPEYKSSDIENCLALFLIHPIKFSNSPSFDQPFLPIEI